MFYIIHKLIIFIEYINIFIIILLIVILISVITIRVPKNVDFDAKNIQRTLFQFISYSRISIFKHSFLGIRKVATFLVYR